LSEAHPEKSDPAKAQLLLALLVPLILEKVGADTATSAPFLPDRCVLWSELMASLAVGRSGLGPSLDVLLHGDRFEVLRIDAKGVSAEVVESETFRYRTDDPLIDEAVRFPGLTLIADVPVSARVGCPCPDRTRTVELSDSVLDSVG
jgi:hypothetical protein